MVIAAACNASVAIYRRILSWIYTDQSSLVLENGAMCLGRAPGFRKSVVDDALEAVIRTAAQ